MFSKQHELPTPVQHHIITAASAVVVAAGLGRGYRKAEEILMDYDLHPTKSYMGATIVKGPAHQAALNVAANYRKLYRRITRR